VLEQPAGHHSSALQDQLGLGLQKHRSDREHPRGRRQPDARAPRVAQRAHERRIWKRVWRGDIDDAVDLRVVDQPPYRGQKIFVMDPRDELPAIARFAAKAGWTLGR